jgi:hypothetical protein
VQLIFLVGLFSMAGLGLAVQGVLATDWASRLLSLALLCLCADQARMAIVDLRNIQTIATVHKDDPRLAWFHKITISTIILELLGFYLAWYQLGGGALLVLASQVWFNGLAGVQLDPDAAEPIQAWGLRDRALVLVADGVGIGLTLLWIRAIDQLPVAIGLLAMVLIYGLVKYRFT